MQEIAAVFDGVKRGGGVTLHENEAIDDHASDLERKRALAKDQDKRWRDVPQEDLRTHDGLVFFDAEGFRYYLPAYLIWYLRNIDNSSPDFWSNTFDAVLAVLKGGNSSILDAHSEEKFGKLSPEERRVVARFLEFEAARKDAELLRNDLWFQQMKTDEGWTDAAVQAYLAQATTPNDARRALEKYWGRFLKTASA